MANDPLDAQAALDDAAAAERRSAQIATSTPWYAPWYGITCAGFPVAFALIAAHLVAVEIAVVLVLLASLATLVYTYQRVTGVWPSIRGTSRHLIALIVVMVGTGTLSYLVANSYGVGWWLLAVFVVTAVLMALLSRSYDAALVRKHSAR